MKILPILAAFAATMSATLATSPAAAQAPVSGVQVTISYADLDLASQSGVSTLNRRILNAVQAACGTESPSDPHGTNLIRACRHRSLDQASSQVRRAVTLARSDGPTVLAGR